MTQITLLYTGDIHARVDQLLRAAYKAQRQLYELNALGRHVILVDTGDVEDRALIESDLSKGAAMFRLLKAAGYDASAVGNGAAMSYGPQVLHDITRISDLPLLCANLLTRDPEPVPVPGVIPTLIIPCGPLRVGLIGLTDDFNGTYQRVFAVTTPDIVETAWRHITALRAEGCHVIGVVSHLGYDKDVRLARELPDLDFILGGHSHTLLRYPADVKGTPICHSGEYGEFLGRLDLMLDSQGRVHDWTGHLIPVEEDGPLHAEAAETWHAILGETQAVLKQPVGHLETAAPLAIDRACGMGQLLADALRARVAADAAFCITGHLLGGLPEGEITLADLIQACRSSANTAITTLSGDQIVRALEHGATPGVWQQSPPSMRGATVGILQVSGLTYHLNHGAPTGQRVSDVRIIGKPIEPDAQYRIAATDYEFAPESGYIPDLDPNAVELDVPWVMREVLQDHLHAFDPLAPGLRPRISVEHENDDYIGPAVKRSLPETSPPSFDDTDNYIGPAVKPSLPETSPPLPDDTGNYIGPAIKPDDLKKQ